MASDLGLAQVISEPVVPSSLYKYVSPEVAKLILSTLRIRWSSPLAFNDPFDITQTLRLDFDPATIGPLALREMVRLLGDAAPPPITASAELRVLHELVLKTVDPKRIPALLEEMLALDTTPTALGKASFDALRTAWVETLPKLRILCFSEAKDVAPMWNHYADAYRGVVLEFHPDKSVDSALQLARPVVYQDEPPSIASPQAWAAAVVRENEKGLSRLFSESQYVKQTSWAYEREWRVVGMAPLGESGLFSDMLFHPLELRGVYLGTKTTEEDRNSIARLVDERFLHARVYQASLRTPGPGFDFAPLK